MGPCDDEGKSPAEVDLLDRDAQPMQTSPPHEVQSIPLLSGDMAGQTDGPSSSADLAAHPAAAAGLAAHPAAAADLPAHPAAAAAPTDVLVHNGDETEVAVVPNEETASPTTPPLPKEGPGLPPNQEALASMVGDYGDESPPDHPAVPMSDDEPEAGEILMPKPARMPPQPIDHMEIDEAGPVEPDEPVAGKP